MVPRPEGGGAGELRIIAGRWRSRRLRFPAVAGLRPTPGRVRETLFNWLQPVLPGAVCLDLFAGSGALGFEALSRGAARVTLVESHREALAALRANAAELAAADGAEIVAADALEYLQRPVTAADIVFLDPPYQQDLLQPAGALLAGRGWVRPGGWVYLETPAGGDPPLPAGWRLHRSRRAGEVGYHLVQVAPAAATAAGNPAP